MCTNEKYANPLMYVSYTTKGQGYFKEGTIKFNFDISSYKLSPGVVPGPIQITACGQSSHEMTLTCTGVQQSPPVTYSLAQAFPDLDPPINTESQQPMGAL